MSNKMWGGRFKGSSSEIMTAINASISFDQRLYLQDITGSIAHATMLGDQNIITKDDAKSIIEGLLQIQQEIENNEFTFSVKLEDIHMNIEQRLREIIGPIAGKLHTARSRNDQVATDIRLYVRDELDELLPALANLQKNLVAQARTHAHTIMPGFTHLQSAQPVTFGHHCLAYVEMFARDAGRLEDARKRVNLCPLGAAALAGTSFPIDRHKTAEDLHFSAPMANSLDAVSARDFAMEVLSASSILGVHLSRLAEEIIIWSSAPFSLVKLTDKWTTGSSIMPQKRNPDAAELIRGKSSRLIGNMNTLLTLLKGLPLAYAKDMQEDKEPLFDTLDNLRLMIDALAAMVSDLTPQAENMLKAAAKDYATATDLADWLVRVLALPFRDAHHVTGAIVAFAEEQHKQLDELSLEEMQKVEPRITRDIFSVLSVEQSVASRKSYGGTSPARVLEQVKMWEKHLEC